LHYQLVQSSSKNNIVSYCSTITTLTDDFVIFVRMQPAGRVCIAALHTPEAFQIQITNGIKQPRSFPTRSGECAPLERHCGNFCAAT
jgi:hypothetical protein